MAYDTKITNEKATTTENIPTSENSIISNKLLLSLILIY